MKKETFKNIAYLSNLVLAVACYAIVLVNLFIKPSNLLHNLASYISCGMAVLNFGIFFIFLNKRERFFSGFLMAGVIFATLGDLFLGESTILGGSLFAVGHFLYLTAFCIIRFSFKGMLKDFLFMLGFTVIGILVLVLPKANYGGYLILIIAYLCVLSIMLGKAVSNAVFDKENRYLNIRLALGAFLFYFSDIMLLLNWFTGAGVVADKLCLMTYFAAQIILACGALFATVAKKKIEETPKEKDSNKSNLLV